MTLSVEREPPRGDLDRKASMSDNCVGITVRLQKRGKP